VHLVYSARNEGDNLENKLGLLTHYLMKSSWRDENV